MLQTVVQPARQASPAVRLLTVKLGTVRRTHRRIVSLGSGEPVRIKLAA